jgi:nitroreductase
MSNETIQTILKRYSCRAFGDKVPSQEDLQLIAKAAIASPSGINRQPWQVIVVQNQELIEEMEAEGLKGIEALPDKSLYEQIQSRGGKLLYNAKSIIFIAINPGSQLDCGILTENIALAATSLGIDNCIAGLASFVFRTDKGDEFKKKINFPEGYDLGASVLLGYALSPEGKPHELDLSKITFIK